MSSVLRSVGELPAQWEFRRWASRVSVVALCLVLVGLVVRVGGESGRTAASVETARVELEKEIRADCDFKLRMARTPELSQYPTAALVELAAAARAAYIAKGCEQAGHGPPPPTFTARPSPTPAG